MRWKTKRIPKEGDTRERFPFAWLPTKIDDYTVWLERYWVQEELMHVAEVDDGVVYPVKKWVEIKRGIPHYY
mgnify:CR=1 FL=1